MGSTTTFSIVPLVIGNIAATTTLWLRTLRDVVLLNSDLAHLCISMWRPAAAAVWSLSLLREWLVTWMLLWAVQIPLWLTFAPPQPVIVVHAQVRLLLLFTRFVQRRIWGADGASSAPSYAMFDAMEWVARARPLAVVVARVGAPIVLLVCRSCLLSEADRAQSEDIKKHMSDWLILMEMVVILCYVLDVWNTVRQHARCWRRQMPYWTLGYMSFCRSESDPAEENVCAICLDSTCRPIESVFNSIGSMRSVGSRCPGLSACRMRPRFSGAVAGLSCVRASRATDEKEGFLDFSMRLATLRRCGHSFHATCLLQALKSGSFSYQCPLCRSSLRHQDELLELTAPQEERLGGVLQAFAVGFIALASIAMCWLLLFLLFGLPPIALHELPVERFSDNVTRTQQSLEEELQQRQTYLQPVWALEAYFSISVLFGIGTGYAMHRLVEVISEIDGLSFVTAAHFAFAALVQFLIEVLATL